LVSHTNGRTDITGVCEQRPKIEKVVGNQIKEDEMGSVCSIHGRGEKRIHFGWKTLREETTWKT